MKPETQIEQPPKTEPLECPHCRATSNAPRSGQARPNRCDVCGRHLIPAGGPKEAQVRRYLYGRGRRPLPLLDKAAVGIEASNDHP
jgi:hypothetical protein